MSLGIGKILTASQKGTCARLDPVKVEGLIAEIKQKTIQAVGAQRADRIACCNSKQSPSPFLSYGCRLGKDFLLPLFEFHLWGCTGTKTRRSSLRLRLARYCALERFAGLSKAMTESLRGWREPLANELTSGCLVCFSTSNAEVPHPSAARMGRSPPWHSPTDQAARRLHRA